MIQRILLFLLLPVAVFSQQRVEKWATFRSPGGGLAATTAFSETTVYPTYISLDWRSVAGANNYVVQRSTDLAFTSPTVIYTDQPSTCTDSGLTSGVKYYYRVKAQTSGFDDSPWTIDSATTSSSTYDPDAQRYLDSAGIGAGTFATATHALFYGLKLDTLFDLYSFIHLYGGSSYASAKWNARFQINDTLAYKLVEIGSGITYNSAGATLNGTNQAFNTKFIPAAAGLDNTTGAHISFYSATNAAVNQYIMGIYQWLYIAPDPDNAASYIRVGATHSSGVKQNCQGIHLANRAPNGANQRYLHDNSVIINAAVAFSKYQEASGNNEVFIGALNDVTDLYFNGNIGFDTGGKGMTPSQESNHYSRFHTWLTAIGR